MLAVRVATAALVLVNVIVKVLVPPEKIVAGENALLTVGRAVAVRFAVACEVLLPKSVTSPPTGMILLVVPKVDCVTVAMRVQLPGAPAGIAPPAAKVIVLPPATPVLVPTQVPVIVPVVNVTPRGRVSTSALVRVAILALKLVRVMVNMLVPLTVIFVGEKAFVTD
jgi:hypothetical protein